MEIKFKIETLGYIVAEFSLNNKSLKIGHSSSYGDKFQELLNNLFFIYEKVNTNNKDYFPYSFEIIWNDDYINYRWEINIDSAESFIKIKVFELSPSNIKHKVELLNEEIEIETLFNNIYLSLNQAFVDFGFVGYKKNWEVGNFPIYEYLTLKAVKEKIHLQTIKVPNEEEWKQKVTIDDELKVINSHPSWQCTI